MTRREFPAAVKVAVVKRSTRGRIVYCEGCCLPTKDYRIDHKRADGLLGEPTLANAQLLGRCCYAAKDAADTTAIAKAKRREARHLGVKPPGVNTIRGQGFRKFEKPPAIGAAKVDKDGLPALPRRDIFTRGTIK